jgi:hypothetical protein
MTGRHLNDFQDFRGKLLKKQQKPKFSSDLLTMRKVEEHLVRSEKYAEAQKTKEKADERERIETEKWVEQKRKEMDRNEVLFKKGKQQELTALQKRLQAGREDLKKQKKIALERYGNEGTFTFGTLSRLIPVHLLFFYAGCVDCYSATKMLKMNLRPNICLKE